MALTDNLIYQGLMNNDWQDSIGTNHGTASGAIFSTDAKLGSHAGLFDGVDDFVTLANETAFDFERTTAFSIECWIIFTATGERYFMTKALPSGTFRGWVFFRHEDNKIYLSLNNTTNTNMLRVYTNNVFSSTTNLIPLIIVSKFAPILYLDSVS